VAGVIGIKDIEEARRRIDDFIYTSPCTVSETFSRLCGSRCWFKFENLQRTGSFKERGALNKLLSLSAEERARGIITASAGNHAQAVAYHAGRLGIPATVVMPERTPLIKVTNTRGFGARVVQAGGSFDEAVAQARAIQEREGLIFVHAFDDELIVAGQGTIGLELLEQNPYLEAVVVPIGGGGLISGIATAIKEVNPRVRVIGVQTAALPSMKAYLEKGEPVTMEHASTIADGIAVKRAGGITLEYVKRYVDEIVTVEEEEIASAILLLLEREKAVVEGAGAASVAAMMSGKLPGLAGKKTVVLLSGGNIDVNLISRIIERGLVKDGRLVRLVVRIADRPGSLAKVITTVGDGQANVIEVHHDRSFKQLGLGETEVALTLETRGREHIDALLKMLAERGYPATEVA
jgi:threonine dehydratase